MVRKKTTFVVENFFSIVQVAEKIVLKHRKYLILNEPIYYYSIHIYACIMYIRRILTFETVE